MQVSSGGPGLTPLTGNTSSMNFDTDLSKRGGCRHGECVENTRVAELLCKGAGRLHKGLYLPVLALSRMVSPLQSWRKTSHAAQRLLTGVQGVFEQVVLICVHERLSKGRSCFEGASDVL